jgi:hypothetical protein
MGQEAGEGYRMERVGWGRGCRREKVSRNGREGVQK